MHHARRAPLPRLRRRALPRPRRVHAARARSLTDRFAIVLAERVSFRSFSDERVVESQRALSGKTEAVAFSFNLIRIPASDDATEVRRMVEANRPARTFTVWLSDDADRVPLKVSAKTELGEITVDLTDYTRP